MEKLFTFFFSKNCFDTLFDEDNIGSAEFLKCLQFVASKLLGYLIVAGSVFLKVPQIIQIVRAKSAEGISFSMCYLELFSYSIMVAYCLHLNYPFSVYGDSVFVLIQVIILIFILHYYSNALNFRFAVGATVYFAVLSVMLGGFLNTPTLSFLQSLTIPLATSSRLPQIWQNFSSGSVGNLNFLTFFLNFGGALARVFTTISELNEPLLLLGFSLSAFLNGIIVFQIVYYNNFATKTKKE